MSIFYPFFNLRNLLYLIWQPERRHIVRGNHLVWSSQMWHNTTQGTLICRVTSTETARRNISECSASLWTHLSMRSFLSPSPKQRHHEKKQSACTSNRQGVWKHSLRPPVFDPVNDLNQFCNTKDKGQRI